MRAWDEAQMIVHSGDLLVVVTPTPVVWSFEGRKKHVSGEKGEKLEVYEGGSWPVPLARICYCRGPEMKGRSLEWRETLAWQGEGKL